MKKEFVPRSLDVRAFAQAGGHLEGQTPVSEMRRLAGEAVPLDRGAVASVTWSATGALRQPSGATAPQVWLEVSAATRIPLVCQRCLEPVETGIDVHRDFRFVADERTAAQEDEDAEEDVLVFSRDFDLLALIEDELLMAMPLVARHDACAAELPLLEAEEPPETERRQPFAALARLKGNKSS